MRLTRQSPWLSAAQACKLDELAPELDDISGIQSNVCDFASGCDWKGPIRPGLIPFLRPKTIQATKKLHLCVLHAAKDCWTVDSWAQRL